MKGEGNQQDYGMRVYDPRIGKFLSIDPLTVKYPWYTPYQFAGNTPTNAIDLDGAEPYDNVMDKANLTAEFMDAAASIAFPNSSKDNSKIEIA